MRQVGELASDLSCPTAATSLRTSGPSAIAQPGALAKWRLESQTLVRLEYQGTQVMAWLQSTSDYPETVWEPASSDEGQLWLSRRAREALNIPPGVTPAVTLRLPPRVRLEFGSARIDDLPRGTEVDVAEPVLTTLAGRHGYALLVAEGRCMPVKLRNRPLDAGQVRLSMLARSLLGLLPPAIGEAGAVPQPDRTVLLCALPEDEARWWERVLRRSPPRGGTIARLAQGCARSTGSVLERLLGPVLGTPRFAFRTTEALVGDDVHPVVRLPPASFPLIGIRPGDQVVLTWADRAAVAIALEQVSLSLQTAEDLRRHQMVDLRAGRHPRDGDHLTVEVAASIRHVLGIPRETVLQVHRRLWPQIAVRLNGLIVPVGGLLLAAAAVPGFEPRWMWMGLLGILALEVLHLRLPAPPRGRWS